MFCIPQCEKMIENETMTNIQISDFTCCVKLYRAMAYSKGKGYGKGKQSEYLDYCVSRVDPADRGMRTQGQTKTIKNRLMETKRKGFKTFKPKL